MANNYFHNVCYAVDTKDHMIDAINDFLDESIVLPPGDWASKNLLSMQEIQNMRKRKKERKEEIEQVSFIKSTDLLSLTLFNCMKL